MNNYNISDDREMTITSQCYSLKQNFKTCPTVKRYAKHTQSTAKTFRI